MNRQPILGMFKCSEASAWIVGGNPPKPPALFGSQQERATEAGFYSAFNFNAGNGAAKP
jgi:hypothetical protein